MSTGICTNSTSQGAATPSQADFRAAMAKLPAAVNIITSDGPGGKVGITATAMCSLTDSPPSVLVCLHEASRATQAILQNGHLAVNMLGAGAEALSGAFAGQQGLDMPERFALEGARWISLSTGSPILEGSPGAFDCLISEAHKVGTHYVLCCRVQALHSGDNQQSLLYHQREYKYC